jgi:hypothetical protein
MTNDPMTTIKKHILKPGKHQFAPGSHATHHNNNLTDAEAEWYLQLYPHIATLFEKTPESESEESKIESVESPTKSVESETQSVKSQQKSVKSINNEDLSTTN